MQLISPNFSDLLTPNIEIGKFPDGDSHVHIPLLAECKGQEVTIFHRLYPDQNNALVELLLILDALKYEGAKITVVAAYLPYARQDKQTLEGEIASAHVICNLLARSGCQKFVTFDCHFLNEVGQVQYGELLIQNLSMSGELIAHARKIFAGETFEIIGPDAGADYLVKGSGGTSLKKVRKAYENGKVDYRHIDTMEGEMAVKGKKVRILDHIVY